MQPFNFGSTTATTTAASSPFTFGAAKTTAPTLNLSSTTNTGAGGFNFGSNKTTASTGLLGKQKHYEMEIDCTLPMESINHNTLC